MILIENLETQISCQIAIMGRSDNLKVTGATTETQDLAWLSPYTIAK